MTSSVHRQQDRPRTWVVTVAACYGGSPDDAFFGLERHEASSSAIALQVIAPRLRVMGYDVPTLALDESPLAVAATSKPT